MIDIRDIIFNYGEKRVLDRISGAIDRGSVTALVGGVCALILPNAARPEGANP